MAETGNFKLIIEDDEGRRSVVPVDLGEASIGRLEGNTIRLNERNVSRRHARLFKETAGIVAEDLDSYNGVFVNGDRVKGRREVKNGDILRIGDFQLELKGEGLASRTEETTQRTTVPEVEATQPEIRLSSAAQPASTHTSPRPSAAPHAAPQPAPQPVTSEPPEQRAEPTAIIRMSHLEDVEASRRDKAAIAGQKAKLICVSTEFAGREFDITKTEIVIGRTEDNDIAIDHRSVSRHHAKIQVQGKSFKVIDLKSANGTLINGEEYAQVDLKRGDLVEFGHVKFRFVPPGESYALNPEEQQALAKAKRGEVDVGADETIPGPSTASRRTAPRIGEVLRSNQLLVIAIGVLVIAIMGMVVWLVTSSGGDNVSAAAHEGTLADPNGRGNAPPPPAMASNGSEADKLVARANAAMVQKQFPQAVAFASAALGINPEHTGAQEVKVRAQAEADAQVSFDAAMAAVKANNWPKAWEYLQLIPEKSVYATQAAETRNQVKGALYSAKVAEADKALVAGDFDTAQAMASEIGALDPSRPDALRIMNAVANGRQTAGPRTPTVRPQPRGPDTGKRPGPVAVPTPGLVKPKPESVPESSPTEDPKALDAEARAALKVGDTAKAIDLWTRCTKVAPDYCICHRNMGVAYAKSSNATKAYGAYKKYLKVCPDAKDAAQVQELIKQFEASQ